MGVNVLHVDDLVVTFPVGGQRGARLRAVDGVSFSVGPRETFGLIGESGSGKSTVGRAIAGLTRPEQGTITIDGHRTGDLSSRRLRALRTRFQLVFQDSSEALDPRMTARQSIAEPLRVHRRYDAGAVERLLDRVGLDAVHGDRRPHELSGGQRQRVNIARGLALQPDLLICDEVVSALDLSIQAQILNLLCELQDEAGLALLFISHDLNVVAHISDRVGVMYLGTLLEVGPTAEVVSGPLHPYTEALMSAEPEAIPGSQRRRERIVLSGEIPSILAPPSGCRFRTRCRYAQPRCAEEVPALRPIGPDRLVACHFAEDLGLIGSPGAGHQPAIDGSGPDPDPSFVTTPTAWSDQEGHP